MAGVEIERDWSEIKLVLFQTGQPCYGRRPLGEGGTYSTETVELPDLAIPPFPDIVGLRRLVRTGVKTFVSVVGGGGGRIGRIRTP